MSEALEAEQKTNPQGDPITSVAAPKADLTSGRKARNDALDEFKELIKKEYLPEGEAEPKYTPVQVSGALSALRERVFREITLGGTRIVSQRRLALEPCEAWKGLRHGRGIAYLPSRCLPAAW